MAFVLSSVSGNLISAASAGYAPTNSGDVSAIASAYQVVSATGTQLYAGTTYVTSVNEAPISADRAGRAGNATLATSAYYDTNARFISALPDSAAVSAIASAYAESAASSKQDTLAFAYNTADQISSINGSALGGMDEAAVSAIASAYQVVSSIETSNYYKNGWVTGIKRINNMYIAAAFSPDGGALATQGDISGVIDTVSSNSATWGQGGVDSATCSAIASAYAESAASSKLDTTAFNSGDFQPVTGMSSYALSADVSATVDLVGTQSANWGGSALALSAGPGVKLNMVGNTLVASTDETVLWSDSVGSATVTASENIFNFERCRVTYMGGAAIRGEVERDISSSITTYNLTFPYFRPDSTNFIQFQCTTMTVSNNGTTVAFTDGKRLWLPPSAGSIGNDTQPIQCTKIVGINRTAGV